MVNPQSVLMTAAALLLCQPVFACQPSFEVANQTEVYPNVINGNDGPADAATAGFVINHFSLIVNDLAESRYFYGEILGMRHMFTYEASANLSFMYMSLAHGGKNGTGYQTGAELTREKNNSEGLIEFICNTYSKERRVYEPTRRATFSHIGLIVPDVLALQARLDSYNIPILKRAGEKPDIGNPTSGAFGITDPESQDAIEALKGVLLSGFLEFAIVADPDGNLLEVQPQGGR
ncbi:hypothetical protein DL95DRAFT_483824 [Leptodontidium sp. 2 PMI_412]|nr:hypothetical protein DL95DRAFT_483824 [Leptodontidium sp. 2 PMI_412]